MPEKDDEPPPYSARPLRLLSLDGGGIRGLSSLYILKYLMKRVNPNKPPKPCEYFDLIGGTSTGGLIAIMLGRFHMSVDECIDKYLQLSSAAFQPKRSKTNILGAVKDKLQAKGAYRSETLANEFKKVSEAILGSEDAELLDPEGTCRVFVCAFRKTMNTPVKFRSYAADKDADVSSVVNCKIWEAARATSAAATFFDPITIGIHNYVDGATGCNNPVEEVLHEALSIWPNSLPYIHCIVSIGTGVPGPKDFGNDLVDVLMTLKTISTETETTAERFRRTQALLGLSGRYFRFNVIKGLEAVRLDEHKKVKEIEAATDKYLKSQDAMKSANRLTQLAARGNIDLNAKVDATGKDKYLGWLPVPDPWQYHNGVRGLRIDKSTGSWFLEEKFETWCTTPRYLLWLCSKAGSGKTILSSTIVDNIRSRIQSSGSGALAFFYFSFQDHQRQDVNTLKRSLLVQIVQQICHAKSKSLAGKKPFYIPRAFSALHELYYPSADPSIEDIDNTLLGALQDSPKTYIVVDAVDECLTLRDRLAVIECLDWLSSNASFDVHVLFTSRPEADIDDAFSRVSIRKQIVQFDPLQIDADISSHVSSLMDRQPYQRWSAGLKSKVKTHLSSKADGVFRWADLQMQELAGKSREKDVERALKRLPETLGQTYARILQKIEHDGYGEEALMVLRWLVYSHRPLTLAETSEIAAFQIDDDSDSGEQRVTFNPADRFDDQWEIRRILAGLVTVTAQGRDLPGVETAADAREITISLSHFSVKEYLEGQTVAPNYFHLNWKTSQWLIVRASADYICQACKMIDKVSEEQSFPLLLYACFNIWPHISAITQESGLLTTTEAPVMKLLSQYPQITDCEFLVSPRFFQAHHGCDSGELEIDMDENGYSTNEFLDKLFQSQNLRLSEYETTRPRRYPLHWAAMHGDVQTARLCVRAGIPLDECKSHVARSEEHFELMAGAAWEPTDDYHYNHDYPTPLAQAVLRGREDVVKLLIQSYKTNVNQSTDHKHTMPPLLQAAFDGNEGIVRALLQRPDLDVNICDVHGRNALSVAASEGHATIFQILLDNGGIDTRLRDGLGQSIFARAAKNGHERVVDILRPMVAHVPNFLDDTDRQAILDTLCRGNGNVLRTILESNPDMDCSSKDSWGTTILSRAAYRGFEEVVQVLLSHSDDNLLEPDNFGFTALDWARYCGHKNVANILQSHLSCTILPETRMDEGMSDSTSSTNEGHGQSLHTSDAKSLPVDTRTIPRLQFEVRGTPKWAEEIWCVAFSRDGRRLATGHSTGDISIWQSNTATLIWTLNDSREGVAHLSWSPDDSFLLSCGREGKARLWDPDDGVLIRTTPRLRQPYSASVWDPHGNFLLLGSFDSYYSIQQLTTDNWPDCMSTWKTGSTYRTEALALSPEGHKLVRMTDEEILEVFDVSTRSVITTIQMPSRALSIEISWDSKNILVNTQGDNLQVLDIETGLPVRYYVGPSLRTEYIVRAVFGGPRDEFVLSAAEGDCIYLWDRNTGDILDRPEGHRPRSNDVAWNPRNPYMFASVGDDGKLKMQVLSHIPF